MTIFELEDANGKGLVKIKEDAFYSHLNLRYCPNPYCGCGSCEFDFIKKDDSEEASKGISLKVDVFEQTLELLDEEGNKEQLDEAINYKYYLEEKLTVDDWDFLKSCHLMLKQYDVEKLGINDKYECHFSKEHLQDKSLMIAYQAIFPFCKLFQVEKEGKTYDILDLYCKNPDCNCNDVRLELFDGHESIGSLEFNYRKGTVKNQAYQWVIDQLKEKEPGIKDYLHKRKLEVTALYLKALTTALEKKNLLLREKKRKLETEHTKVGRNDKCPCGSGKKYKKCCLNIKF